MTKEDVSLVLSSFSWNEKADFVQTPLTTAAGNRIGGMGFRLGVLAGQNLTKERAEYIGFENRQKTKKRIIDQLEQQVCELREQQGGIKAVSYTHLDYYTCQLIHAHEN